MGGAILSARTLVGAGRVGLGGMSAAILSDVLPVPC